MRDDDSRMHKIDSAVELLSEACDGGELQRILLSVTFRRVADLLMRKTLLKPRKQLVPPEDLKVRHRLLLESDEECTRTPQTA